MSQDYQWADALRKAQLQAKQSTPKLTVSPDPQITTEQLQEQMAYYKTKLQEAAAKKDQKLINELLERLINNHARQTALLIKRAKEAGATDNSPVVLSHIQKYFSDCTQLTGLFPS